ncbi:DUF3892 domain-containing protein [Mycolicibacterium sp. P1-5]|uniref:DUF3892 domain-containing protein n=1 Tax=Mycolicibacterium sp. P1-5 TaxID=2024617 RepID=UPI0011EC4891|nr:DUF3892 domain-containing protein [Mycolicibacterium sp. P1-5]KAA0112255.1 DUF3892 domain-containing protein [Mycolicibacterium sp. P1-5]
MRYQIIARRTSPSHSDDYRHIVEVQYRVGSDVGTCPREQMVNRLDRGDTAFIAAENQHSEVGVFDLFRSKAWRRAKYLRSYGHDDFWNESLSRLPTF